MTRLPRLLAVLAAGTTIAGACAIGSTDIPPAAHSPAPPLAAGAPDWPTYHGDRARSGLAHGAAGPFRSARQAWPDRTVDGDVYASPIVARGLVIVATENDSVYAFDAATGRQRWFRHLGTPVTSSTLPCGNIAPVTGITGTPVADPDAGTVSVVAFVRPAEHLLFTLDLETGADHAQARPVDPPGDPPTVEQQRGALSVTGGMVLVPYGGLTGDCGAYHGWIVGAPIDGGPLVTYQVPCGRECGLWAPGGPTVDQDGDVWVATGNSDSQGDFDFGNAVVRLSPGLAVKDWFAPADWAALNRSDRDLGSISPALLDGDLVWTSGKGGIGYLLRRDNLGHLGGQAATGSICATFAGSAYGASTLYLSCPDQLVAVSVDASRPSFSVRWRRSLDAPGSAILAYGALWVVDTGSGAVSALNPANGRDLVSLRSSGRAMHFATPAAAGGRVFAAVGRSLRAIAVEAAG